MEDGFELVGWWCANAEGGGVWGFEIGVLLFEVSEFSKEVVVFSVGESGLAEDVVVVVRAV